MRNVKYILYPKIGHLSLPNPSENYLDHFNDMITFIYKED